MDTPGFSSLVQQFQTALPSLGVSYSGPVDGLVNPTFINSMLALEMKLEMDTGIPAINHIFSGGKVIMPLQTLKEIYFKKKPIETQVKPTNDESAPIQQTDSTTTTNDSVVNPDVKNWQSFLSQSLPIIGKLYSGPVDGLMNDDLIAAAKSAEQKVSAKLKNNTIVGKIISNGKFITDPSDLQEGLNMLNKLN